MKKNIFILLLSILALVSSCKKDPVLPDDEVYEFVFLSVEELSMNELTNSTEGNEIEIHAEMLAEPRDVDVVVTVEITGINAAEGVDYEIVSPLSQITIPAGAYSSEEGLMLRTVNNGLASTDDRTVQITLQSASDSELKIGKGISSPTNTITNVAIIDDECSDDITLFNNAVWTFDGSNTVYYSTYSGSFTTTINGDKMMITGDIANYDVGITVIATLTPDPQAPTTGTISFDPSTVGNDGTYDYRWILKEGSYDICAQTISLSTVLEYIDIYGPVPTAWVEWYTSDINATISIPGGTGPAPPSGTVNGNETVLAGNDVIISGSFTDAQGLSEVSIMNTDLGISSQIMLSGEFMYDLSETFTIDPMVAPGDYTVNVSVMNIENLTADFDVIVSVLEDTACSATFAIFDADSLTVTGDITVTDGSFNPYIFTKDVYSTIEGDSITIQGDFIDFFEIELKAQVVPDLNDQTFGIINLETEDLGTHTDGFTYRLVPKQDGTYNACEGKILFNFDIEYEDSGSWVFYYTVEAEFVTK